RSRLHLDRQWALGAADLLVQLATARLGLVLAHTGSMMHLLLHAGLVLVRLAGGLVYALLAAQAQLAALLLVAQVLRVCGMLRAFGRGRMNHGLRRRGKHRHQQGRREDTGKPTPRPL